jgi:hypothetical protein
VGETRAVKPTRAIAASNNLGCYLRSAAIDSSAKRCCDWTAAQWPPYPLRSVAEPQLLFKKKHQLVGFSQK